MYTQDTLGPQRKFSVAELLAPTTNAMLKESVAIKEMSPAKHTALLRDRQLLGELRQHMGDPSNEALVLLGFPRGFVDTGNTDAAMVGFQRLAAVLSPEKDGIATRFFKDIERMIGIEFDTSKAEQKETK